MYLLQAPKRRLGLRFYYFKKPSYFPININNLRFALWLINHLEVRIPLNYLHSKELHVTRKSHVAQSKLIYEENMERSQLLTAAKEIDS